MSEINFHLIDCIEFMKSKPDKCYDLAIVDPPYGIGAGLETYGKRIKKHSVKNWDSCIPEDEYFIELRRVSENQIIWGGNYFDLPLTNSWVVWDKDKQKDTTFSDGELAWTSFKMPLKILKHRYDGFIGMDKDGRIHPTQKPVDLYRKLLKDYAKHGMRILDTHGGSFSHAIACDMEGFDLDICEIDKEYFNSGVARFKEYKRNLIFDFK